MIYNLFLLLMDGGCILSISPFQLPHAIGYHFHSPNIACLILFPNINQTPKQNYPSKLEKIWRCLFEYIPIYQSSLQCDFCILNHLVTRPVSKGGLRPHGKTFFSPEKCLGNIACITIVFVHAIDVKFGPPSENSSPFWCPKQVTGLLVAVALWLLLVMPLSSVFSHSKFSGLTSNFNRRN